MTRTEILIVGAGPAGMAAASVCGNRALWIDENPKPGGQIWRGGKPVDALSRRWFGQLPSTPREARVISIEPGCALVESTHGAERIAFQKLILATGARELFLPFPGWTLPGVFGAGGLQALVKSGFSVRGKRVVVAGSGPLLLAVGAYLRKQGGEVVGVFEQAPWLRLALFLAAHPSKAWQGFLLQRGLSFRTSTWVTRFTGDAVELNDGSRVACDYVATGFGLIPNVELRACFPPADPNVFVAGEICGIGGVDKALLEGQIAAMRALEADPAGLIPAHRQALRFAADLNRAFALRDELKRLPQDDTIVCRCEDICFGALKDRAGWRDAKLQTRCGMGPCQGRVCGPANQFLFGWDLPQPRPPFSAARVDSLLQNEEEVSS